MSKKIDFEDWIKSYAELSPGSMSPNPHTDAHIGAAILALVKLINESAVENVDLKKFDTQKIAALPKAWAGDAPDAGDETDEEGNE